MYSSKVILAGLVILSSVTQAQAVGFSGEAAFNQIWNTGRENFYSVPKSEQFFTPATYARLLPAAKNSMTPDELAKVVNPFLLTLNTSHTDLYTKSDLEFYLFKSMFETQNINEPKLFQIGVQGETLEDNRFKITSVMDGSPAEASGLKRDDLILSADGAIFHPGNTFTGVQAKYLQVIRRGKKFSLLVAPAYDSIQGAFLKATIASESYQVIRGKRIAYIHVWCGTDDAFAAELARFAQEAKSKSDGFILDLRDGFGGAWYEYLDPFFKNHEGFYSASSTGRDNLTVVTPADKVADHDFYDKPMTVIINEGVRSGKEAVAYQFKKSHRATLIGATTKGYLSTGKVFFLPGTDGYLLYLSISSILLNQDVIEKIGVSPDIFAPAASQRKAAEQALRALLN